MFPGRAFDNGEIEFQGVSPTPENTFFLLRDEESGKTYDVEEMSWENRRYSPSFISSYKRGSGTA